MSVCTELLDGFGLHPGENLGVHLGMIQDNLMSDGLERIVSRNLQFAAMHIQYRRTGGYIVVLLLMELLLVLNEFVSFRSSAGFPLRCALIARLRLRGSVF